MQKIKIIGVAGGRGRLHHQTYEVIYGTILVLG